MKRKIWITWESHRRTIELATALPNVQLFKLEFNGHWMVRYPYLISRTLLFLTRERPNLIIVQNPSLVLTFIVVTVGKCFGKRVVVDAHNEGLNPFYDKHKLLLPIYRWLQKEADLTIVTNKKLAVQVQENHGRPFVLPDKLPSFHDVKPTTLVSRHNITYVCTYEKDEPWAEVIKAAHIIKPNITIYITGDIKKVPGDILESAPANIIFTGFLPEKEYAALLYSSNGVMDLTTLDNCLVCGAYEAVSLKKPMILSDTFILRSYFNRGALFTQNEYKSIAYKIEELIENFALLREEVAELRKSLIADWQKQWDAFKSFVTDSF